MIVQPPSNKAHRKWVLNQTLFLTSTEGERRRKRGCPALRKDGELFFVRICAWWVWFSVTPRQPMQAHAALLTERQTGREDHKSEKKRHLDPHQRSGQRFRKQRATRVG
jgi:hypothetical protein